jgi:uncharacterized protein (DUF1778 family)
MTLTLEIAPEIEATLKGVAASHGQSLSDYAAELLAQAAEDAADVADAERIMANSDPSKRRTLAELRTAIYGEQEAKAA